MQAVINACHTHILQAVPAVVITNNPNCLALKKAVQASIPHFVVNIKTHADPDQSMIDICKSKNIDLLVLAGYMKKVGNELLTTFHNRIINIHPSLLPKYGGQGMYGRYVHEAVLDAGDSKTGATVHLVNQEYDKGSILAQEIVNVEQLDTVESLASRVLAIEHKLLVETLNKFISQELIRKS